MSDDDEGVAGLSSFNGETKANDFLPWWHVQQPASKQVQRREDVNIDFLEDEDMKSLEAICKQWQGATLTVTELELIAALGGDLQNNPLQTSFATSKGDVEEFLAHRRRLTDRRGMMFGNSFRESLRASPMDRCSSPDGSDDEMPPLSPRLQSIITPAMGKAETRQPQRGRRKSTAGSGGLSSGLSSVLDSTLNALPLMPDEMRVTKPPPRGVQAAAARFTSGRRRSLAHAGASMSASPLPSPRPASTGQILCSEGARRMSARLLPHVVA